MRVLLLSAIGAAVLWSSPVEAGHWTFWPSFTFGYGYGHGPYPYYGPHVGIGVHVAPPPYPAPRERAPEPAQGALKLYVYPAAGQSDAQTAEDRYQCHVWAAGESGHDPTLGAGSRAEADGYTRAFTACLEGRGYVVR